MAGRKGPNFSELEKCILVELIGSRRDIIESKTSDAKMILKKNKEWDDLAAEFNSRHGINKRTTAQPKSLWKNLKSKTKSAVAKERRDQTKTGGGVSEVTTDKISSAVREIIPQQKTSKTPLIRRSSNLAHMLLLSNILLSWVLPGHLATMFVKLH